MKSYKLFLSILTATLIIASCGKPSDPESLKDDKYTGGYTIISKFASKGFAQDLVVKNNLAYIAQGEVGLMIVDVTDRKNPRTVSITTDNVRGYSAKIAMKDTVVYLATGTFGITVVDVTDPENPQVNESLSITPARNLYVHGNSLFAAISERGVRIVDITYAAQPIRQGRTQTLGYARDIAITSDTTKMLVACGELGLSIFDISNFQNGLGTYPLIGTCNTPGYAEAVVIDESKSLAFLACGTSGLQIVDFSDPLNIHIVGSLDEGAYAKELVYKNQRIYLTTGRRGLKIIDVKDPSHPYLIGTVLTEHALGLYVDDNYIYLADESEGLIIISISENTI